MIKEQRVEKDTTLDRNLAMELVRVTEGAAIAASRYMGTGNKEAGDGAAVDAMRSILKSVHTDGLVVIGEGEKDEAPMLYNGEKVGNGKGNKTDIAVDPVEGTRLLAKGTANAIAVIAAAERGTMWNPGSSLYMKKLVVERKARYVIDIKKSATENLHRIAEALSRNIRDLTVFVLEKDRHKKLIEEIRKTGARISLHTDGDVMGALMAAIPGTGIDILMGTGGTPEGVLAACAVKAVGGDMQGMRDPQLKDEIKNLQDEKVNLSSVLDLDDLVKTDNTFFAATGITQGGSFLEGVHYDRGNGFITTESVVMRSLTESIRYIKGIHKARN